MTDPVTKLVEDIGADFTKSITDQTAALHAKANVLLILLVLMLVADLFTLAVSLIVLVKVF